MNVLIVDGQGGGIGRALAERLRQRLPEVELSCVGANSLATAAMLKAGVTAAATGENAICVCARRADVIVGPIGIVLKDALMGEITARAAEAIASSDAVRVLIPVARCRTFVAGCQDLPLQKLIDDAVDRIAALAKG